MIVPDANLLLYAYDSDSPFHRPAARWWAALLAGTEPVGLCPVVVFAFLRLATNAKVFAEPLTVAEASEHLGSWLQRPNVRMLVAGPGHLDAVVRLLAKAGTGGNLVTDAQIAALARNMARPSIRPTRIFPGSRASIGRIRSSGDARGRIPPAPPFC